MLCLKIAGWVANSVDPDEMPHSAASHLVLYCLLRPVGPNTYGKYGNFVKSSVSKCHLSVSLYSESGLFDLNNQIDYTLAFTFKSRLFIIKKLQEIDDDIIVLYVYFYRNNPE